MSKPLRKMWYRLALNQPVLATRITYRVHFHRWPDFKHPRAFTEKLQWLKLFRYRHNPLVTQCIDKYAVRDYITEIGCPELLNEVYGCWDSASDIPWEELPEKFVLKCTHGSGMNIICTDKNSLDIPGATSQLEKWLHQQCGVNSVELLYEDIKPRILAEKFIDTMDGNAPKDYKFFCSYGEPKFLFVASSTMRC